MVSNKAQHLMLGAGITAALLAVIGVLVWLARRAGGDRHTQAVTATLSGASCNNLGAVAGQVLCGATATYPANGKTIQTPVTYRESQANNGTLQLYIDPSNPSDSVLSRPSATKDYAGVGVLAFVILLVWGALYWSARKA